MEEGDLQDVHGEMLHFWVVGDIQQRDVQEAVNRRVPNGPTERLQNVPLHLEKHVIVVQRAAHRLQLPDRWDVLLLVTVFGRDEKGRTPHQLIMPLVHHPLRAVPVQEIDRQEQRGGKKLERGMGFDQEVEEVRTHEPLDLRLDIDRFDIGKGGSLANTPVRQSSTPDTETRHAHPSLAYGPAHHPGTHPWQRSRDGRQ